MSKIAVITVNRKEFDQWVSTWGDAGKDYIFVDDKAKLQGLILSEVVLGAFWYLVPDHHRLIKMANCHVRYPH